MFYPLSIVITVLVLAPNPLLLWRPPVNPPANPYKEPVSLVVLERLGQIGCFVSPLFYAIYLTGTPEIVAAVGMGLMLSIYYICWIRFFTHKREYRWLFWPLFSIPVPMATCPVLYFLLASAILHSIPLLVSSLVFAAGHIPISLRQYKHIKLSA